jgi:hypothetical protein
MPGSTITANLIAPYTSPWSFSTIGGGGSGTWADSTNSTFTVPAHPFVTGDVMYVKLFNAQSSSVTGTQKYYAIFVSPTQLRYASSYANAIAGTALTIPSALSTVVQNAIGNHPSIGYASVYNPGFYNPSTWMASSVSVNSFASTENVQIDFTLSGSSGGIPISASLFTKSLSYICGFFQNDSLQSIVGEGNSSTYTFSNNQQNLTQTVPAVVRFTLQNRRISTAIRLNSGTYLTRFTGILLATNLDPLFFAVNMGINGYNANNCTITYL